MRRLKEARLEVPQRKRTLYVYSACTNLGELFYLRDLFMPVESETIKGTLMRSKMENLCRELQKQNKTVLVLWILLVVCNAIPCNSTAHCRRTANASRKTKWSKGESFVRTCVRI